MAEFIQQAHLLTHKNRIAGWYMSEKLPGVRCFWDGGLSRDMPTTSVPFANHDKKAKPKATGLWDRYGNPIAAPDWWINQLPPMPLDGDLYAGKGNYRKCCTIVNESIAADWESIEYATYDSPSLEAVFSTRTINNRGLRKTIIREHVDSWLHSLPDSRLAEYISLPPTAKFEEVIAFLDTNLDSQGRIYLHAQRKLPEEEEQARASIDSFLQEVVKAGGRGVVVRNPLGVWETKQTRNVLEVREPALA